MALLEHRLMRAAASFARAIKEGGGASVLMGGGAVIALGKTDRETKDLDFNLPQQLNPAIVAALRGRGISANALDNRADRFSVNVPESSPGKRDATSVDLAVKPDIAQFVGKYTRDVQGITVADERLLLVDKLICFGQRSEGSGKKIVTDLDDIFFCVSRLDELGMTVPEELSVLLTRKIWDLFWARVKTHRNEDYTLYIDLLPNVGFPKSVLPS